MLALRQMMLIFAIMIMMTMILKMIEIAMKMTMIIAMIFIVVDDDVKGGGTKLDTSRAGISGAIFITFLVSIPRASPNVA